MAGAGGARTWSDGIDTGGYLGSMGMAIANVERYEMDYPMLYLYRRQQRDGGGPGRFRGGTSVEKAYMPHGVEEIETFITHCVGTDVPLSPGSAGGLPAGTNQLFVMRDTDIRAELAASRIPMTPDEIHGRRDVMQGIARSTLGKDDVYCSAAMGAGGYGDPIDRDPALVAADVARSLVSRSMAHAIYGVELAERRIGRRADHAGAAQRDPRRAPGRRDTRATRAGRDEPAAGSDAARWRARARTGG